MKSDARLALVYAAGTLLGLIAFHFVAQHWLS